MDIKFPNGGKFTPYFETLKVGDRIHLEGPFGNFDYLPGGQAIISIAVDIQGDSRRRSKGLWGLQAEAASLLFIRSFGRLPACQAKNR